jgi:hypothetical protein
MLATEATYLHQFVKKARQLLLKLSCNDANILHGWTISFIPAELQTPGI